MLGLRIDDDNRRWWVLGATGASLAVVLLDETVVGVALPTIRDDLGMSQLHSHWVVNAYLLVLTVVVAATGRLGDVLGQRRAFLIGGSLFALGSVASGVAQGGEWIIAARAVQGVGGAFLFAIGAAITATAFSDRERGFAFGIYGVVGTIGIALGPFVGGALTELVSWRAIFFINLPLIAAMLAVLYAAWREPVAPDVRPSLDWRGLLSWVLVVTPFVVALMQGPEWGWGAPATIALLVASALAVPLFILTERRVRDPLMELALLRRPTVVGSNLALACGQRLAALTLGLAWIAVFAGEDSFALLIPGLLVYGLAQNFVFVPPLTAVMSAVPARSRGEAGGIEITAQMLGGTLAVAVLGIALLEGGYTELFSVAGAVALATLLAAVALVHPPPLSSAADG